MRVVSHAPQTVKEAHAARIAEIDPVVPFFQELRNLIAHQGVPAASLSIDEADHSGDIHTRLLVSVSKLAGMTKWSAAARKFIATFEYSIPLDELGERYAQA